MIESAGHNMIRDRIALMVSVIVVEGKHSRRGAAATTPPAATCCARRCDGRTTVKHRLFSTVAYA
jgi:hypothetical protein